MMEVFIRDKIFDNAVIVFGATVGDEVYRADGKILAERGNFGKGLFQVFKHDFGGNTSFDRPSEEVTRKVIDDEIDVRNGTVKISKKSNISDAQGRASIAGRMDAQEAMYPFR